MKILLNKIYRRLLRPFDAFYYRFLAGGDSALNRRLGAAVLAREQGSGKGDVPQSQAQWDQQYSGGQWDFLNQLGEMPRYAVIAGFLQVLSEGGTLLDVGSGEGILLHHLRPTTWSRYLGIDLSTSAIEQGNAAAPEGATFEVADAEEFQPSTLFDGVVLNECLHYFHQPVAEAQRYYRAVKPGGVMIVSIFCSPRGQSIVRQLGRKMPPEEFFEIRSSRGTWAISVYLKPAS